MKLLIWILMIVPSVLFSQRNRMVFEHIGVKDGLSQSSVNCLFQDREGLMWFGTFDGLNCYDGIRFKIFRSDAEDSTAICDNIVKWIEEDENGYLWLGTNNGLSRFDKKTYQFKNYYFLEDDTNSIPHNIVYKLHIDNEKRLWILTADGMCLYSSEKDHFIRYSFESQSNKISTVYDMSDEDSIYAWVGTENDGLLKLNKKTGKFVSVSELSSGLDELAKKTIYSIQKDSNFLWIGTKNGLFTFDDTHLKYKPVTKKSGLFINSLITDIYRDLLKRIWISTWDEGIYLYNSEDKDFIHYQASPFDCHSLSHNLVNCIYEDLSGVIWIATRNGINKYSRKRTGFVHYVKNYHQNSDNSLPNNDITLIYEDRDENIWIGTTEGIVLFKEAEEEFIPITKFYPKLKKIKDEIIMSFMEDRDGFYWIGTIQGLYQVNKNNGKYTYYSQDKGKDFSLSNNGIVSLFQDSKGDIWIGTWNGLNRIIYQKDSICVYFYDYKDSSSLGNNLVWEILEDSDGDLWFATDGGGLNQYDRENDVFIRYLHVPGKNSIENNRVIALMESYNGEIWVGTAAGLNIFHKSKENFELIDVDDGLQSDVIYSISEDRSRNVWITTNRGLSKYDRFSKQIKNFSIHDGIQDYEFNNNVKAVLSDGRIAVGGINGFNLFDPLNIKKSQMKPPVVFTDLKLYNRSVGIGEKINKRVILHKSINQTDELTLSYKDDYFVIEFAALHYEAPRYNRFAYILEGVYQEWIETTAENAFASFSNLAPGEYNLKVIACNSDDYWNYDGKSLKIVITPPFWQTKLFYFTASILFLFLLYSIYEWRIMSVRKQKQELEILVFERTEELRKKAVELKDYAEKLEESNRTKNKFFSIIAHDLRNPFISILTGLEYLNNNYASLEDERIKLFIDNIFLSGNKLFHLLNSLLEWTKAHSDYIQYRPEKKNICRIISDVIQLLFNYAEENEIEIIFQEKENLYIYGDVKMLETVLRNLIVNGIKFSNKKSFIDISVKEDGDNIYVKVKDNGIGLSRKDIDKLFRMDVNMNEVGDSQEKGSGLGLLLCKEFIDKHGGKIWVESELGKGSSFIFMLPKAKK